MDDGDNPNNPFPVDIMTFIAAAAAHAGFDENDVPGLLAAPPLTGMVAAPDGGGDLGGPGGPPPRSPIFVPGQDLGPETPLNQARPGAPPPRSPIFVPGQDLGPETALTGNQAPREGTIGGGMAGTSTTRSTRVSSSRPTGGYVPWGAAPFSSFASQGLLQPPSIPGISLRGIGGGNNNVVRREGDHMPPPAFVGGRGPLLQNVFELGPPLSSSSSRPRQPEQQQGGQPASGVSGPVRRSSVSGPEPPVQPDGDPAGSQDPA